jgi:hypothetical protein
MHMKRLLLTLLIGLTAPLVANAQALVGTYKLVAFTVESDDGKSRDFFGKQPTGLLILTPKRLTTMVVHENRSAGTTSEQKAALLNSMISYSGPYQIEGSRLVTDIDISWNQSFTGGKQARNWKLDGNRLTLTTDRVPSIADPSIMGTARTVWEKVE